MSVKIVAFLTPKSGREVEVETLVYALVAGSRTEPGNLRYDAWRDTAAGRIMIDELYVDHAAIDAHRAAPHYQAFSDGVIDLLAESPVVTVVEELHVA